MDIETKKTTSEPLMHTLTNKSSSPLPKLVILLVVITILGIGTGYILAQGSGKASSATTGAVINKASVSSGKIYGEQDEKLFKNMREVPEGVLKEGGIDGEGQYHLVRDGGPARYVYLTSSTVDLSQLIDRKLKVWGDTLQAERAGWLMDVRRVEVLE